LTIIWRLVLGLYSAFNSDNQERTLFVVGMAFVFVMYNLINLPFKSALHNYRGVFVSPGVVGDTAVYKLLPKHEEQHTDGGEVEFAQHGAVLVGNDRLMCISSICHRSYIAY
jgi:hypothetical protein